MSPPTLRNLHQNYRGRHPMPRRRSTKQGKPRVTRASERSSTAMPGTVTPTRPPPPAPARRTPSVISGVRYVWWEASHSRVFTYMGDLPTPSGPSLRRPWTPPLLALPPPPPLAGYQAKMYPKFRPAECFASWGTQARVRKLSKGFRLGVHATGGQGQGRGGGAG